MTAQTGKPASWKVNAYKSLFRNFIWEKIDANLSSGSPQMFFVEQAGNLTINLEWSVIFLCSGLQFHRLDPETLGRDKER